jgi:orotidine-5'-phosphate decarboxylase
LKTHIDIVRDFDIHLLLELQDMAQKMRFLLLEDRRFTEDKSIVEEQYEHGLYKIANWAHLVTVAPQTGSRVIQGLRQVGLQMGRGALLHSDFHSTSALLQESIQDQYVDLAREFSDYIVGFVSPQKLTDQPYFVHMSPRISFISNAIHNPLPTNTPEQAIIEADSDVMIVGEPILYSTEPVKAAEMYRKAGWDAYQNKIS